MLSILVVSREPRLIDALRANFGSSVEVEVVSEAVAASTELFQRNFDLVHIDYEAIRGEPFETIVTIDNVLTQERRLAVLLIRKEEDAPERLAEQLGSIKTVIDLSLGRDQFDERVKESVADARQNKRDVAADASVSTDRLAREEIDLPAANDGSIVDLPLARLLYTLFQRKETGVLELTYSTHTLRFGILGGDLVKGGGFEAASELEGAFSWSHGKFSFETKSVDGMTTPMLDVIAEGCRSHIRQRAITEEMSPVMRRYPVPTNLWSGERGDHLRGYEVLKRIMDDCDGSTNWETLLSSLGNDVADGFRAAYFAIQTDLVFTLPQPGVLGIMINYSRAVRQARERVDQAEVEKTKAFKAASSTQRSKLERELAVTLAKMRDQTIHEVFGVWEGCGRKVVQDRFYTLVKEHHPDVYGGNTSGDVKEYAQDIFILIKDSYQKLLAKEKDQKVPPPAGFADAATEKARTKSAAPAAETPSPRKRIDTPRFSDPAGSPRRGPAPAAPAPPVEEEKIDVKEKLSMLSGFRKKQKARKRLASVSGRSEAEEVSEPSVAEPEPVEELAPESSVVEDEVESAELERQAKLDKLLRRAQKVSHPDAPTPSKEFFNRGYHAYREDRKKEAFEAFSKAYELDPMDPPNMVFYAYTMFLNDPETKDRAEEMLREALGKGNRQSAPDAFLFLGYVLKAKGEIDEAVKFFKRAHQLNPASRDAEREVRLAEKRSPGRHKSDPGGGLLKNLFKK